MSYSTKSVFLIWGRTAYLLASVVPAGVGEAQSPEWTLQLLEAELEDQLQQKPSGTLQWETITDKTQLVKLFNSIKKENPV